MLRAFRGGLLPLLFAGPIMLHLVCSVNTVCLVWVYEKVVGKQEKRWYPHL